MAAIELLLDKVASWLKVAHMLGVELERTPSAKLFTAIAGCSSIDELRWLLGVNADPADEADEAALQLLLNGMALPCCTPPAVPVDRPAVDPPQLESSNPAHLFVRADASTAAVQMPSTPYKNHGAL